MTATTPALPFTPSSSRAAGSRRARARDRRVYLGSHPVLFALLAATRRFPVARLGSTVLVHDRDAYVTALTKVPLDRTAEGTTGGAAGRLTGADLLFDQQGEEHRRTRRTTAEHLGTAGVARLRPIWTDILTRELAPLANGGEVDLVQVAARVSGATAAALLDRAPCPHAAADAARTENADALAADQIAVGGLAATDALAADTLAAAARAAGAAAARAHLPSLATVVPRSRTLARIPALSRWAARSRARSDQAAADAAARLTALTAPDGGPSAGLSTMLAVAAINTTVAALPRAAAWAADADMWHYAETHPQQLADELLRVTSATPLLPRVAGAEADLNGHPVHTGDRLMLVARHAVAAHTDPPDPRNPAPAAVGQLVFGTGPHTCPGARLARTQMADLLTALAPYRPVVVRARPDRDSALPSWRTLIIRGTT